MSRTRTDTPAPSRRPARPTSGRAAHDPPLKIRLPDLSRVAAPFGREAEAEEVPYTAPADATVEPAPPTIAATALGWRDRATRLAALGRQAASKLNWKWYGGGAIALVGATVFAFSGGSTPAPTTVSANREPLSPPPLVVAAPPMPSMTVPAALSPLDMPSDVAPPGGSDAFASPPAVAPEFAAPTDYGPTPGFTAAPFAGPPAAVAASPIAPTPGQPGVARLAGFIIDEQSPPVEARNEPYRQSFH